MPSESLAGIITAACAVIGVCLTIAGAALGFAIYHDRAITQLQEQVRSLRATLSGLPKRKGEL